MLLFASMYFHFLLKISCWRKEGRQPDVMREPLPVYPQAHPGVGHEKGPNPVWSGSPRLCGDQAGNMSTGLFDKCWEALSFGLLSRWKIGKDWKWHAIPRCFDHVSNDGRPGGDWREGRLCNLCLLGGSLQQCMLQCGLLLQWGYWATLNRLPVF